MWLLARKTKVCKEKPIDLQFTNHEEVWNIWVDNYDIEISVKNKFGVIINMGPKKVHITRIP